jgi:hypothetical protein
MSLNLFAKLSLPSRQRGIQRESGGSQRRRLAQRIIPVREGEGTRVSPGVLDNPLGPVEQDEDHAVFRGLPELKFEVVAEADPDPPRGHKSRKEVPVPQSLSRWVSGFEATGHPHMQELRFSPENRRAGEKSRLSDGSLRASFAQAATQFGLGDLRDFSCSQTRQCPR